MSSSLIEQMKAAGTLGAAREMPRGPTAESRLMARLGLPADADAAAILEAADLALTELGEMRRLFCGLRDHRDQLVAELGVAHGELREAAVAWGAGEGSPLNQPSPDGPPTGEVVARQRLELAGAHQYINDLIREEDARTAGLKPLAHTVREQIRGLRPVWTRGEYANQNGYTVFLPINHATALLELFPQPSAPPVDWPADPV